MNSIEILKSEHQMDSTRNGLRVVLFPIPLQGHINPTIQLSSILYSLGLSISIVQTDYNSVNPSTFPQFDFLTIPLPFNETDPAPKDILDFVIKLNITCISPLMECLKDIIADPSRGRVVCLITDTLLYAARAAADKFNIRWLVLRSTSTFAFLAFAALPLLREKESRLVEPIPELPPCKIKDIYLIKGENPDDLFRICTSLTGGIKASSGIIWNTDLERTKIAEFSKKFPIPNFPIGPFHKFCPATSSSLFKADESSLQWLDEQETNSVIYVSFGSLAVIDENEFQEIAWGLINSKQPFLWVVRPGLVLREQKLDQLLEGFFKVAGDKCRVVKWAPQQAALAHRATGGFWTHGGWNSTLESICEGVPMICHPAFGDQKVNTRYVSDVWRVGIHLENRIERGEIEKAIRKLMTSEEGEAMRGRIGILKEKGEECLRPGKSSYNALERLVDHILQT